VSKLKLDGPADAEKELLQLLEFNDIKAQKEGKNLRFILSSKGVKWETLCCPTDDGAVLIYGIYPFKVTDKEKALDFCQCVNKEARYGSMIYDDCRLAFRIGSDLFDIYSAYETLGRALEYSAGIMTRFWVKATTVAGATSKMHD